MNGPVQIFSNLLINIDQRLKVLEYKLSITNDESQKNHIERVIKELLKKKVMLMSHKRECLNQESHLYAGIQSIFLPNNGDITLLNAFRIRYINDESSDFMDDETFWSYNSDSSSTYNLDTSESYSYSLSSDYESSEY